MLYASLSFFNLDMFARFCLVASGTKMASVGAGAGVGSGTASVCLAASCVRERKAAMKAAKLCGCAKSGQHINQLTGPRLHVLA